MTSRLRPFLGPLDGAILVVLAAAALWPLAAPAGRGAATTLSISGRDGVVASFPLSVDRVVRVPGPLGETIVSIAGGKARVAESPCPGRDCVRGGTVSRPGQSLVCLPNLVAITVRGEPDPWGIDAVSR